MNQQSVRDQQMEIWQASLDAVGNNRPRQRSVSKRLLSENYRLFLEILESHLAALQRLVQILELRSPDHRDLIEDQLIRAYAGDDEEQEKMRHVISVMPNLGGCVHTSLGDNLSMVIRGLLALVDPVLGYHAASLVHEMSQHRRHQTESVRNLLVDLNHITDFETSFLRCMTVQASSSDRNRWDQATRRSQARSEESLGLLRRYDMIEA